MMLKKSKQKSLMQLTIAIIVIAVFSFITSLVFFRIDLTAEKRYTLTKQTKNILNNLNDDLLIKIFLEGDDLPVSFKRMSRSIKELIDEFKVYCNAEIKVEIINPTDTTDKNKMRSIFKQLYAKRLTPIEIHEQSSEGKTSQKLIFPHAIIACQGKEAGINLLKNDPQFAQESEDNINNSIESLEYEFINAILKLTKKNKPQVAFIEGHGELDEIQVMDFTRTLSEYYLVKRGKIGGQFGILDSFKTIIIAKPQKPFDEKDKFVIDQYIMRGGKVFWLIDGAYINNDSLTSAPSTIAIANELNLEDQLFKYGARINPDVVLDWLCSLIGIPQASQGGQTRINTYPWFFYPMVRSYNFHPVTKYLNYVRTEYVSSVDTVGSSPKVRKSILLATSDNSSSEYVPIKVSLETVKHRPDKSLFKKSKLPVAVLLEGNFESVYKNRSTGLFLKDKHLFKDESLPTKMVVVGDGDIIRNIVSQSGQIYPVGFDRAAQRVAKGNAEFLLNVMNYLCDDDGLMSIRMRNLQIRLLDKKAISEKKLLWQVLNLSLPLFIVCCFGFVVYFVRRKKYGRI